MVYTIHFYNNYLLVPVNKIPIDILFNFEDYTDLIGNFFMNSVYGLLNTCDNPYIIGTHVPIDINNFFDSYFISEQSA